MESDNNIRKNEWQGRLRTLDIVSLIILTPLVYVGLVKLLLIPIADIFYNGQRPSLSTIFLVILAFDFVFVMLMIKLRPIKDVRIATFVITFVLTLSCVIFTCFLVANALSGAFG